ncbi:MAG: SDR family oxidoreductase [Chloroflexota bacterium]
MKSILNIVKLAALVWLFRSLWRRMRTGRTIPAYPASDPGTALITGASSGIGATYARRLASEGYDLILVARRTALLETLCEELRSTYDIQATPLTADLATKAGVDAVSQCIQQQDNLDILINNAGFGTLGTLVETKLDSQLAMLHVHMTATMQCTHAALPAMIARQRGAIINVSSVAAFIHMRGGVNYCATKAYLNNFSQGLQSEIKSSGVRIQALCPGFTYTGFHDTEEYALIGRSRGPAFLWMQADDVVDASLRGLSSGQVVVVPGHFYQFAVFLLKLPLVGDVLRRLR